MLSGEILTDVKKTLITLTVLTALGAASAQTAQDIINKVDATQKAAKDVSFRLSGTANFETQSQKIDLTVKSIPAQKLARIQFMAPDALADNIVVADSKEVRQYMFLTNQITVTPLNKAASSVGISGLDFNNLGNTSDMLKSYNVKLIGTTGSAGSRVFQLEATPKSGSAEKSRVWISEAGWRPNKIQAFDKNGKLVADMTISNYKVNSGLTATALKSLPKDAQIIKQ
ncbi:outer membrane lipoprotein carrier protein LolA [Deinococcus cavernae]|uniref:Outer membrane lipoprotein carrier protein LolA n=1 Tax=Deinococcus cavernae TaxID=2320857 RepID=A0A418VAZ7_9DEIO|nr:outer membrane lipoprotein carrier protein LolA [Deinococcus cavernae]